MTWTSTKSFSASPQSPYVIEEACRLLDHYPLQAYDAMQLGGCVAFAPAVPDGVTFVSSDENLLRAAEAEGFDAPNPANCWLHAIKYLLFHRPMS